MRLWIKLVIIALFLIFIFSGLLLALILKIVQLCAALVVWVIFSIIARFAH